VVVDNACIGRCAYPVFNSNESSIFCVSNQVAETLATTFLRYHLPEPACRPPIAVRSLKTFLNIHEKQNTENTEELHSLDEM